MLLPQDARCRPAAPPSSQTPSCPSLCSHPATGWPQPSSGECFIPVCSHSETHHMHKQPLLHSHVPAHPPLDSTSRQPPPTCRHPHLPAVLCLTPPSFPHTHVPTSSPCPSSLSPFSPKLHLMMLLCRKATVPQCTTRLHNACPSLLFTDLGVLCG